MHIRICRLSLPAAAALLVVMTMSAGARPAAQAPAPNAWPASDLGTTERVVAIGDVHGAYDRFVETLRAAGLVDTRTRWSGGRAILVQTGDVVDRGPDSRKALDLLRRLEGEASRAGGRVFGLLGNHEFMRLIFDWRYVSAEEIAAFRTGNSADLRERAHGLVFADMVRRAKEAQQPAPDEAAFRDQFMKDIPLGYIEMRQAFGPAGEYGKWLRERHAVVKINGIVFVHGGINAATAALGCAGINEAVRRDLMVANPTPEQTLAMLSSSETGPLWYRGLAEEPEAAFAPEVTNILGLLGARAIVVGHTFPAGFRIVTRFDGRVIQIDTGMLGGSFYQGGVGSALEIRGDMLSAIYQTGRERLSAPAPTPTPASR